jgi:hypothetical protein
MALNKPLYHTITEKLWPGQTASVKQRLYEMLVPLVVLLFITLVHFFFNLFNRGIIFCAVCDAGMVLVSFLQSSAL